MSYAAMSYPDEKINWMTAGSFLQKPECFPLLALTAKQTDIVLDFMFESLLQAADTADKRHCRSNLLNQIFQSHCVSNHWTN